jgi:hypothetical protein
VVAVSLVLYEIDDARRLVAVWAILKD